ncbi:MAG TPA: DUF2059 domain-containing protein [Thermoanaerobaculia bacterium]|jgi:hypothetical protein
MRIRAKAVLLLAMLFSLSSVLAAQPPTAGMSHEQAARELLDLVGGKDLAKTMSLAMVSQFRSNPDLAPYEDVFAKWIEKVYSQGDFERELVRLYVESFTEDELRQLTAIYKTPVGHKALRKLPELMQKGMAVGQRIAQEHMPELESMLAARKKELEAKEPTKPPQ